MPIRVEFANYPAYCFLDQSKVVLAVNFDCEVHRVAGKNSRVFDISSDTIVYLFPDFPIELVS